MLRLGKHPADHGCVYAVALVVCVCVNGGVFVYVCGGGGVSVGKRKGDGRWRVKGGRRGECQV